MTNNQSSNESDLSPPSSGSGAPSRFLVFLVVIMGVMLLMGTAILFYEIARRSSLMMQNVDVAEYSKEPHQTSSRDIEIILGPGEIIGDVMLSNAHIIIPILLSTENKTQPKPSRKGKIIQLVVFNLETMTITEKITFQNR